MLSITFIITIFFSFIVGYCFGRISTITSLLNKVHTNANDQNAPVSFFDKIESEKKEKQKISIDDRTFVTKVDIESYDKKFSELGKTTMSEDNIEASVSKLAQLKKK